jgi:hypothetical protein
MNTAPHSPLARLRRRTRCHSAFSLVELMIAVGLLAIIMVALMMAFQQVQRALHTGLNQADILENGRAIMTLISRDLQEITYSDDATATNFYVSSPKPPLTTNRFGMNCALQDLFILIQTNNAWYSVKYSFDQNDTDKALPLAVLYRKVNPPSTNVLAVATTNVTDMTGADPLAAGFHRVADGIVHFKVQALGPDGQPYSSTNTPTLTIIDGPAGYQSATFNCTNIPSFIDVEIGIVEPRTLKEFNVMLDDGSSTARDRAIAFLLDRPGKVHIFRQRIPIRSQYRTAL